MSWVKSLPTCCAPRKLPHPRNLLKYNSHSDMKDSASAASSTTSERPKNERRAIPIMRKWEREKEKNRETRTWKSHHPSPGYIYTCEYMCVRPLGKLHRHQRFDAFHENDVENAKTPSLSREMDIPSAVLIFRGRRPQGIYIPRRHRRRRRCAVPRAHR